MLPLLVVVTGLPAAGKTTLARQLAASTNLPLFSKDGIKETLYDALGTGDLAWSRRLGAATFDLLFHILGSELAAGRSCLVEGNFDAQRATPRFNALQTIHLFRPFQLLCVAEGATLLSRYAARIGTRHPGHHDTEVLATASATLLTGIAEPLGLGGTLITVDTTNPAAIDVDGLSRLISGEARLTA